MTFGKWSCWGVSTADGFIWALAGDGGTPQEFVVRKLESEGKEWGTGHGPRLKQELGGELFNGSGPALKEHESVAVMTRVWLSEGP